jgi:hypothetical protein
MRFRPALFVGLGHYGCEIARHICTTIRAANDETASLVALLEIRDDGTVVHDHEDSSEENKLRLQLGQADSYAGRFELIADAEPALSRVFVRVLGSLRRRNIHIRLEETGTRVDSRTAVYFVAPLCDDVGSVALIGCIELFKNLVSTRLAGQDLRRAVLAFFPDLFPDFRDNDERYARTYVCLQELEFVASTTEQSAPFEFVHLFTAKNEENENISSHEDLALALGEALNLMLRREIDDSFAGVLVNPDEYGAVRRYSSLGTSKLVLPREEICRALDGHFAARVMEDFGIGRSSSIDRHVASADVRKFIYDTHLLDVEKQLENNASGRPIWSRPARTLGKSAIGMNPVDILAQVAGDNDRFEQQEVTRMTREIRERHAQLAQTHHANLRKAVSMEIDRGGLLGVEALLDVFLNVQSEVTTGDVIDVAVTIDDVDRHARKFFDDLLGIDRKQLSKLQEAIISKEIALGQHDAEAATLGPSPERPADAAAPDAKALETVIASTTTELKEKRQQYAQLRQTVATHDRQLKDGAYRRSLLQGQRNEAEEEASGLSGSLENAHQDWRAKRALEAEEKRRGRSVLKKVALYSLGGLVLYALVAVVMQERFDRAMAWKIGWYLLAAAILWNIGGGVRIWQRLQNAKAARLKAASRKDFVIKEIEGHHDDAFRTVYLFGVHGASLGWVTEFRSVGEHIRRDLRDFRRALQLLHDEEQKAYDGVQFALTLFRRSVVVPSEVKEFLNAADRYDLERNRFHVDHPLSAEFQSFVDTRGLNGLLQALRTTSAEVFDRVRHLSIEQLLREREAAARLKLPEKLLQLFRFGTPLIQLHVERGKDQAQSMRYLGAAFGSESPLYDLAQKYGQQPHIYRTTADTEITVVTIKAGFPAHHVALVINCDHVMEQRRGAPSLQVLPDWPLQPLIPSALMLGTEDDPERQLVCESLALGVLTKTPQGLVMDGTVVGPSYRTVIEILRSLRGTGLKGKLQVKRASRLRDPDAAEKLSAFLTHGAGDAIDQRIIQTALDRLDDPRLV